MKSTPHTAPRLQAPPGHAAALSDGSATQQPHHHATASERVRSFLAGGTAEPSPTSGAWAGRPPAPCHQIKSHRTPTQPRQKATLARDLKPSVVWAQNGSYVHLHRPQAAGSTPRPGVRRQITEFTHRSRRNLLRQVNCIDRQLLDADRVTLTTLTYPEKFPTARESKRHLDAVLKRFRRAYPDAAGWWKIEPQRRGAPHFHLLTVNPAGTDAKELACWWAENWVDVVGTADPAERQKHQFWHLGLLGNGNRLCTEQIRTWNGVTTYAAKYIGKKLDADLTAAAGWDSPGRMWGNFQYDKLPVSMATDEDLTPPQAARIRRQLVRWYDHQPSGRYRVTDADDGRPLRREPRRYFTPAQAYQFSRVHASDVKLTPIPRRYPRGRLIDAGGCSMFAPSVLVEQIIRWAKSSP